MTPNGAKLSCLSKNFRDKDIDFGKQGARRFLVCFFAITGREIKIILVRAAMQLTAESAGLTNEMYQSTGQS